jgi:acyl-CoA synthetase (NDP forming)
VARDCASAGAHALVVLTSGFGEAGAGGRADQAELLGVCRTAGIRLVGPNCIGVINTDPEVRLDATFLPRPARPGGVALACQSGAVMAGLLDGLARRGSGVSVAVSIGNASDVGADDLLPWCAADPRTRVIAAYLESLGDLPRLARIAADETGSTRIILLKAGRSPAAATAAASHTAAAADDDAAVDGFCRAAGVIRVSSLGELADVAAVLSAQPAPTGRRVGVAGNSGGPGIMAIDAAQNHHLVPAVLDPIAMARLTDRLPAGASVTNPLDATASARAAQLRTAVSTVAADPGVDAVIAVVTALPHLPLARIAGLLAEAGSAHPAVPILACAFGQGRWPGPVPRLEDPDAAAAALNLIMSFPGRGTTPDTAGGSPGRTGRIPALRRVRQGPSWLSAADCEGILRAFDIPTVPGVTAQGEDVAVQAAQLLRYPLVVKAQGIGLVHKSDVGGVITAVHDPDELRSAIRALQARLGDRLDGVLLQPELTGVAELIIGAVRKPRTGPLIMVGRGGIGWDVDPDRAWSLAPVDAAEALEMITSLRMAPILGGYRGRPPVELGPPCQVIARTSDLISQVPAVTEIDLNPVLLTAAGPVVVDARIRLAPDTTVPGLDEIRRLRGTT